MESLTLDGLGELKKLPLILPNKLTEIHFSGLDKIKNLPIMPPNLEILDVNKLPSMTWMPPLPSKLKKFLCRVNLNYLPALPRTVRHLELRYLTIKEIPSTYFPEGLEELILCSLPELVELPKWPINLKVLILAQITKVTTIKEEWPENMCSVMLSSLHNVTNIVHPFPANMFQINIYELYKLEYLPNPASLGKKPNIMSCPNLKEGAILQSEV